MKKFFKKTKSLKWTIIVISLLAFVAWDMAFHGTETVINGSFRSDALFNAPPAPNTKVSVIYKGDKTTVPTYAQVYAMVKAAIDSVGGIGAYVNAGDSVIIKPNLVGAKIWGNGENTNMYVVKAIILLIDSLYTGEDTCTVFVGEGSARTTATMGGTLWNATGYRALLSDSEINALKPVQFVDLNSEGTGTNIIAVPTPYNLAEPFGGACHIHKWLTSPNVKYINVPVLKMHEPGLTCCLKNHIGIGAGWYYGFNKITNNGTGPQMIHHARFNAANNYKTWQDEELTDLTSCIDHVDLNVVDALMCLETSKTESGSNDVRLNTIVAGSDIVAVDHVCTRIIGGNPDDIAHITMAEKIGLGTNNPDSINIVGITSANIPLIYTQRFDRGNIHSRYGQGNRVWLISNPFASTDMSINHMGTADADLDPSNGAANWSIPYYFFDDRIDLNSYHGYASDQNAITYLYTSIYSPTLLTNKQLWLNREEAMKVYLNGALVYDYAGTDPNSELVRDSATLITLNPGENRLVVKVLQTTGCYDFSLNICEANTQGNRVAGIKFYIKNYNEPTALGPNLTNPANKTQTKEVGTAISNIVFTWGGTATDVNVAGMPAWMSAIKDMGAKTVTLSGTPLAAGSSTYTVTTVGGTGSVVRTGTVNAIICTALSKINILGLAPSGTYRLALFNAAGTVEIKTLANGSFVAGNSDFMFNRTGIPAGTYTFKVLNGATVVNSGTVILP